MKMNKTIYSLKWIEIVAGAWLIVSPFILNYTSNSLAIWNDVILGVVIGSIGLIVIFKKN